MEIVIIVSTVLGIVLTSLLIWKAVEALKNFEESTGGNLTLSFSLLSF